SGSHPRHRPLEGSTADITCRFWGHSGRRNRARRPGPREHGGVRGARHSCGCRWGWAWRRPPKAKAHADRRDLRSPAGQRANYPEADVREMVIGLIAEAASTASVTGKVIITAAAVQPGLALGGADRVCTCLQVADVPVVAPLPHVAVHVKQPPL